MLRWSNLVVRDVVSWRAKHNLKNKREKMESAGNELNNMQRWNSEFINPEREIQDEEKCSLCRRFTRIILVRKKKVAINSSWSIFPTRWKNDGDVVMLHPFFITMITRAVAIKLSCCSQRSCSNFFFFRFPFSCFTSSSLRLLTRRRRRRNREKHEWWKCVRDRFTLNDDDEFSLLHWEFFPLSY